MDGSINSESVQYHPGDYSFSYEDYIETWNFIFDLDTRENKSSTIKDLEWPEERSYFQILDHEFILNVVSGQGSIFSFHEPYDKIPFVEDCKIIVHMGDLEERFPIWIQKQIKEHERFDKAMKEFWKSEEGKKLSQRWARIWKNE